jgi:hypothetical protein
MPKLYMITVPGLEVKSDWRAVHDRLLDDFPEVTDVLATTTPATILIAYKRRADVDGWFESISETILRPRHKVRPRPRGARSASLVATRTRHRRRP